MMQLAINRFLPSLHGEYARKYDSLRLKLLLGMYRHVIDSFLQA